MLHISKDKKRFFNVKMFLQFQIVFLNSEAEKDGSESADDQLDKLLPELTHFCGYVRDYVANHMGKVPPRDEDDDDYEVDEVSVL